ncbi:hypothetical protein INR49_020931 [Caranx melampygus]|nr:hypothetical protein INR49_020931 [Caranx melampygus]
MGRPTLGEHVKLEVIVEESYEFKHRGQLIKKTNLALLIGTNSWREQFVEAITVSSGDDDDDECGEEKLPSCFDYVMHFLTVFWKLLFALVPPTDYWNGWACFIVSISVIGLLTAVIGTWRLTSAAPSDLKTLSLLWYTFASKVAAIQDQYADASIGNVTGSNAVNVFLVSAWHGPSLPSTTTPKARSSGSTQRSSFTAGGLRSAESSVDPGPEGPHHLFVLQPVVDILNGSSMTGRETTSERLNLLFDFLCEKPWTVLWLLGAGDLQDSTVLILTYLLNIYSIVNLSPLM